MTTSPARERRAAGARSLQPDGWSGVVTLWDSEQLLRWVGTLVVTGVAVLGAWAYVSGRARYGQQVPGIAVSVLALIAAQTAGASLILRGRRAIGVRRVALLGEPALDGPGARPVVAGAEATSGPLVSGEGMTRYHRAECALAVGRPFIPATRSSHESAGRRPCGMCRP